MALASALIETGLATADRYNHLTLNPALCPYLRGLLEDVDREALISRWASAMRGYLGFLMRQQHQRAELAATLTLLELPNLFALLGYVLRAGDAESTVEFATGLHSLLSALGRTRLLTRVAGARDRAAAQISSTWNHARFDAEQSRIADQLVGGQLREARSSASALLAQARATGAEAYPGADYHLAMACLLAGRVLKMTGDAQQPLLLLDEAQRRFEAIEAARSDRGAARAVAVCITERGDCLRDLGRLDDAAAAYEEGIRRDELLDDERGLAVSKVQLGTVRLLQRRHREALEAYADACDHFKKLKEPGSVATVLHQMGVAYRAVNQSEAAEDAYRESLALAVQLDDVTGQAATLNELGPLYSALGRLEEAAAFYRNAAEKYLSLGDTAMEGRSRNNLGDELRKLGRSDEARQEIRRAIECDEPFGHAAEPWKTWAILANIEMDAGNATAAAEARARAIACYQAYRQDGGENHFIDGRLSLAVTEKLVAGDPAAASAALGALAANSDLPAWLRPFVAALQAITTGSRDRSLAANPDLAYTSTAELLHLLDVLDGAAPARPTQ